LGEFLIPDILIICQFLSLYRFRVISTIQEKENSAVDFEEKLLRAST
jgi:hypothetical protein